MLTLLFITWILKVNGWNIPTILWIAEGFCLWIEAISIVKNAIDEVEKEKITKEISLDELRELIDRGEDDGK